MEEKQKIARKALPRDHQALLDPTPSHSVRRAASTGDLAPTPDVHELYGDFPSPAAPSELLGDETAVNGELGSLAGGIRADRERL